MFEFEKCENFDLSNVNSTPLLPGPPPIREILDKLLCLYRGLLGAPGAREFIKDSNEKSTETWNFLERFQNVCKNF